MKKISNFFVSSVFLVILFGLCIGTFFQGRANIFSGIKDIFNTQISSRIQNLETATTENLWMKNTFIEISGGVRKILNLHLTDDRKFFKDSDGLIHLAQGASSYEGLLESTAYLAEHLAQLGTPFLLCQLAERGGEVQGDQYSGLFDKGSTNYIEPLYDVANQFNVLYLDYSETLRKAGFGKTEIFFKTDIHYTTEAELFMLQEIINCLESQTELRFENRDIVFNKDLYTVEEYPFLGNLGSNTGQFYSGTDSFRYYLPTYKTNLTLNNPCRPLVKEGTFEEVCLNRSKRDYNTTARTYRVVDYLQWPSPYYSITNNEIDGKNLLVIGDSMSMRTVAYLSLLCHSVTILDPRYFNETDYLKSVLNYDFDAVVLFATANLRTGIGGYGVDIQTIKTESQTNGTYNIYVDVRNAGTMPWKKEDSIRMSLWLNGVDIGARAELPEGMIIKPEEEIRLEFKDIDITIAEQNFSVKMVKEGGFYFGNDESYKSHEER